MFVAFTVPLAVLLLDGLFLALFNAVYLVSTRRVTGAAAARLPLWQQALITVGVQAGLLLLLILAEVALDLQGGDWQNFILLVAFGSTVLTPLLLLFRQYARISS
jgi:hypothetical protein